MDNARDRNHGAKYIAVDFWQWYEKAKQEAIATNIPLTELDYLIVNVTNLDKLALRLHRGDLNLDEIAQVNNLWRQRVEQRLPVQYLIGEVAWRDLTLKVTPAVLIPRPETELIIDLALEFANHQNQLAQTGIWLDLGTGSGAIAIGLAQTFPNAAIHAVDCSEAALEVAKSNVMINLGDRDRIQFHQGDWFAPVAALKKQVVGMVSNPPYIPTAEIAYLQIEVAAHEPHLALDGGADGLDIIRHLVNIAPEYLISGGFWLVELMAGQAQTVRSLLKTNGNYRQIEIHRDGAGIDRFVSAICD